MTPGEKDVVMELVSRPANRKVLENKKTNASSNIAKLDIWKGIMNDFNAVCQTERNAAQLKNAYNNELSEMRKCLARERISQKITGGGSPETFTSDDNPLLSYVQLSVTPMDNIDSSDELFQDLQHYVDDSNSIDFMNENSEQETADLIDHPEPNASSLPHRNEPYVSSQAAEIANYEDEEYLVNIATHSQTKCSSAGAALPIEIAGDSETHLLPVRERNASSSPSLPPRPKPTTSSSLLLLNRHKTNASSPYCRKPTVRQSNTPSSLAHPRADHPNGPLSSSLPHLCPRQSNAPSLLSLPHPRPRQPIVTSSSSIPRRRSNAPPAARERQSDRGYRDRASEKAKLNLFTPMEESAKMSTEYYRKKCDQAAENILLLKAKRANIPNNNV